MKLDVPDGFVELVKGIGEHVSPSASAIIDALRWASKNPDSALRVAEEAKKLNTIGKREFEHLFRFGYEPDEALEGAIERQRRDSKERSLLSKMIAHAKRGEFRMKLANGIDCEIRESRGDYVFKLNPGGIVVQIHHNGRYLAEALMALAEKSEFSYGKYGISKIILDGKSYSRESNVIGNVLKAIKENVNPFVYAVINDDQIGE